MRVHALKTHDTYYEDVLRGIKPFELRFDDRGFEVGDILELYEVNHVTLEYTGRICCKVVTYILRGIEGHTPLMPGWVVLGIAPVSSEV